MGGKSCFFIGHRESSEEIYPALYAAVEQQKFIRHCMRLLSSTLLNMALQNLSLVTTEDLTVLQRQQSKK